MPFNDLVTNPLHRFSLGVEEGSRRFYLSIPVSSSLVDYEEYYAITEDQFECFKIDLMAAREFAARCVRHQFDDRLMIKPGTHRGVAAPPATAAQLLAAALSRGELHRFILGDAEYRLNSRNDNDDPQYVIGAFEQIFAHWRTTQNADFAEYFTESLLYALAQGTDLNLAIYMTSDWLWRYRYCLHEQGRYAGLFEVDVSTLGEQLKEALEANKASLKEDTRWAGAEWNSPDGLWTPIIHVAHNVRDKLGGPDYVPGNA